MTKIACGTSAFIVLTAGLGADKTQTTGPSLDDLPIALNEALDRLAGRET
jgi:hypothetical protein